MDLVRWAAQLDRMSKEQLLFNAETLAAALTITDDSGQAEVIRELIERYRYSEDQRVH